MGLLIQSHFIHQGAPRIRTLFYFQLEVCIILPFRNLLEGDWIKYNIMWVVGEEAHPPVHRSNPNWCEQSVFWVWDCQAFCTVPYICCTVNLYMKNIQYICNVQSFMSVIHLLDPSYPFHQFFFIFDPGQKQDPLNLPGGGDGKAGSRVSSPVPPPTAAPEVHQSFQSSFSGGIVDYRGHGWKNQNYKITSFFSSSRRI